MPWKEWDAMSLRTEFVRLAQSPGISLAALCRRFGISRKTGYKWLDRHRSGGVDALVDQSRRPRSSPRRTPAEMEERVVSLRKKESWGGRKIHHRLRTDGFSRVPAPSTVTDILRRHGEIDPAGSSRQGPWTSFSAEAPNDLWQMDFKGHIPAGSGRCHPLDVLDDHSRFVPCLSACADELGDTVKDRLTDTFRRYGLPRRMLMDNGPPWSALPQSPHTLLSVWLMRLGIRVSHGRPYHPQTQGKLERFHRTLKAEVLSGRSFSDLGDCQRAFDRWRDVYNLERPHQALGMAVPASLYQPSPRPFPEVLPSIEYGPDDLVRRVQVKGEIHFRGGIYRVGAGFHGQPVALRATGEDGVFLVVFVRTTIATIDLRN